MPVNPTYEQWITFGLKIFILDSNSNTNPALWMIWDKVKVV